MHKYLFVCFFSILFFSCINSKKPLSPQEITDNDTDLSDVNPQILETHREIPPYTHIINDNAELIILADSIVSNAENFSINSDFQNAQNLIKILFEILPLSNYESIEDFDAILSRIAKFYSEKMPPNYLDSIPQSIMAFVASYQFQMIMMEIDTANIDISQFPINCTKGIFYNVSIVYNKRVQQALLALLAAEKNERMIRLLNRSMLYRPFMEEMFKEAELPTDITYLPLLESAFNPKAYSRAHASGLWQFIPSTGRIFGLRDSYWLDERRDPIKSTAAAIAYFKRLYSMFDDWYLALASYNCGEGRVGRLFKAAQEENPNANYWDLTLPRETMNYVPLYIGYQIIAKNPKCFGFIVDSSVTPFPYDTVKVSDCIDMAKIAKGLGISTDNIREINPHIKQFCTPPDVKDVTLYIPTGKREEYYQFYATLKPEDKVKWYRYKIASGDNLGIIARRFGTTIQAIKDMNRMKSNSLVAGRYILLPLPENEAAAKNIIKTQEEAKETAFVRKIQKPESEDGKVNYKISSGETLYSIAMLYGISVNDILKWNPNVKPKFLREGDIVVIYTDKKNVPTEKKPEHAHKTQIQPSENVQKYTVLNGDNLFQISLKLKVSLSDLISWNKKDNDNPIIYPGETLIYYSQKNSSGSENNNIKEVKTAISGKSDVVSYLVKNGDTFYSIAKTFSSSVDELEVLNNMKANELKAGQIIKVLDKIPSSSVNSKSQTAVSTKTDVISYKVQSGDYLYKLASKFNVSVQEICLANNFSQNRQLKAGETIKIPTKK